MSRLVGIAKLLARFFLDEVIYADDQANAVAVCDPKIWRERNGLDQIGICLFETADLIARLTELLLKLSDDVALLFGRLAALAKLAADRVADVNEAVNKRSGQHKNDRFRRPRDLAQKLTRKFTQERLCVVAFWRGAGLERGFFDKLRDGRFAVRRDQGRTAQQARKT